jgi:SAM-dependent methyltransferase
VTDDGVARRTLELFAETPRLNRWLYGRLRPYVRGDVLEIGSGIGSLSREIVADADRAVLSDVDPDCLEALGRAFAGDARVAIVRYDLDRPPPPEIAERRFDAILAVNVLEHVGDDRRLAAILAGLLAPGGRLLVYVPACPFAMSPLDRALGHRRRYTPETLRSVVESAGLVLDESPRYINLAGLVGWLAAGKLLRRAQLSPRAVALFERSMPVVRLEDRVRLPIGLGLCAVARHSGAARP